MSHPTFKLPKTKASFAKSGLYNPLIVKIYGSRVFFGFKSYIVFITIFIKNKSELLLCKIIFVVYIYYFKFVQFILIFRLPTKKYLKQLKILSINDIARFIKKLISIYL